MPAKLDSVPKLRHHKATGQAAVVLDGEWIYLGRYGTPEAQEQYDRLVAEWLSNGRRIVTHEPGAKIADLILAYWHFSETYYRKNGETTAELCAIKAAMRPLKRLYASLPVGEFGPLKLKAVRQAMIEAGHSRRYINDNVNRIKRMIKWGTENELVPASVFHALLAVGGLKRNRSDARETEPVRPVDDSLVDPIRPHVARQVAAMVTLQQLTGMRSGEVTIMRGCDIDMTGPVWLYRPAAHKTEHHGYERVVELGPRSQKVIRPFLKSDLAAYLFSPAEAEAERRTVQHRERKTPVSCGNRPGTNRKQNPRRRPRDRYTTESYRRAIDRAIRVAFPHPELSKIPEAELTDKQRAELDCWRQQHHWHPHQLRHTFATRVRKLYGLETAKLLLGQQTMEAAAIYAEADRQRAAEIMKRIG